MSELKLINVDTGELETIQEKDIKFSGVPDGEGVYPVHFHDGNYKLYKKPAVTPEAPEDLDPPQDDDDLLDDDDNTENNKNDDDSNAE